MTREEPCLVCGRMVQFTARHMRRGPGGGIRCVDHLGEPVPENVDPGHLVPKPGEDYVQAERREYEIVYEARARASWVGVEDDSPSRHELDAGEPEIVDEVTRNLIRVEGFKAVPGTGFEERFDEDAWREQRLEDLGLRDRRPSEKPRPEETLEAFA